MVNAEAMTSIMYGNIAENGSLDVMYFCSSDYGIMDRDMIAKFIRNPPTKEMHKQAPPYWCDVTGRHRLVYTLTAPSWFFPSYRELQQGKEPWKLISRDPMANYSRPEIMDQNFIWNDGDDRIKTTYVDYSGGDESLPYVFDLHINIWDDPADKNSWITPIVIDPGNRGSEP